jgi:hypothetical protein
MFKKDVTRTRPTRKPKGVSNVSHDQRVFSNTAGSVHVANSVRSVPMRGGIRL